MVEGQPVRREKVLEFMIALDPHDAGWVIGEYFKAGLKMAIDGAFAPDKKEQS